MTEHAVVVAGGGPTGMMVPAPAAVPVRPDGYVAWVGDGTGAGLADALGAWFGPPAGVS